MTPTTYPATPVRRTESPLLPSARLTARWLLDEDRSSLDFKAKHAFGLVRFPGRIRTLAGAIDEGGQAELTIDLASIHTGSRRRDRRVLASRRFERDRRVRFSAYLDPSIRGSRTITGILERGDHQSVIDVAARIKGNGRGRLIIDADTAVDAGAIGLGKRTPWPARKLTVRIRAVFQRAPGEGEQR